MTPREYYIPSKTEVIFVADFFVEDEPKGGAELTTEALIEKSPYQVFKLHSAFLTEELVKTNKDKYWILGNWAASPREALISLVTEKCRFSIIEYDFKLCLYRSPQLHKIKEDKVCDCHLQKHGKFVEAFYLRAENVFFMSEKQKQIYLDLLPRLKAKETNMFVQSSTWTDEHLDKLIELSKTPKNGKWAVLSGGTWIKNQQKTEEHCKENQIEYDLIGGLPYEQFIEKLAEYSWLVFLPAAWDTCPRITVEAWIMGLSIRENERVLHKDEHWYKTDDRNVTMTYLRSRTQAFWEKIKL